MVERTFNRGRTCDVVYLAVEWARMDSLELLLAWDAYIYARARPSLFRGMHIYMHNTTHLSSMRWLASVLEQSVSFSKGHELWMLIYAPPLQIYHHTHRT